MIKYLFTQLVKPEKRLGRKPTRSLKELCEEFAVKPRTLGNYLRREGAPKPLIKTRSESSCNTYYDPDEMRKWWKSINLNKEMK